MSVIPAFDLHSDLFLRVLENDLDIGEETPWAQTNLPRMERGGVAEQVFAIWIKEADWPAERGTARALRMIEAFYRTLDRYSDRMALATSMAEADVVTASGRIASFLWLEGGSPICGELDLLGAFHRLGIRGMTLTWTTNLPWAGSGTDPHEPNRGLDKFGKSVIREMNRLGMIVDISHTSERTALDAIAESSAPVIASHSGCRALADTPRNVSDKLLRAIGDCGGMIGIVVVPQFLSLGWEPAWDRAAEASKQEIAHMASQYEQGWAHPEFRAARSALLQKQLPAKSMVTLDTWLDHVVHAVDQAGIEHVGLGSDFDGVWSHTVGLENSSCWQAAVEGLARRGFSPTEIRMVMGDNARRIFRQVLG
ncbi:hypothetical protein GC173_12080 [bacterium]|nr:hypothetical protein [bacterium]